MFGADDNTQTTVNDPAMLDNVAQLAKEPANIFQATQVPASTTTATPPAPAPAHSAQPWNSDDKTDDTSSEDDTSQVDSNNVPEEIKDDSDEADNLTSVSPTSDLSPPPALQVDENLDDNTNTSTPPKDVPDKVPEAPKVIIDTDKLASVKQQALGHLEPLVGHLDQSAEEEFRTTMMMIQANDNHALIEKALEAAKRIEDDNARAQAMLDIINEVNYFAHQASTEE